MEDDLGNLRYTNVTDGEIMADIGGRLRALRKARGMSQSEAADKSGVSRKTVYLAEHGENPTLLTLVRLLRTYGALESLSHFAPEVELSPLELLKASRKKASSG